MAHRSLRAALVHLGGALLLGLPIGLLGGCHATRPPAWQRLETEHIRLTTSVSSYQAEASVRAFQAARDMLAATVLPCAFVNERDKVDVTLVNDREHSQLGIHSSVVSVFLARGSQSEIVVRSQEPEAFRWAFGHYMVSRCYPRAPAWLAFGLAAFVSSIYPLQNPSTPGIRNLAVIVGTPRYWLECEFNVLDPRLQTGLSELGIVGPIGVWELPLLAELQRRTSDQFQALSSTRAGIANAVAAWRLVQYLSLGPAESRSRFTRYLEMLESAETDPSKAWHLVFDDWTWLEADHFDGSGLKVRLPYLAPHREVLVRRDLSAQEWQLHLATLAAITRSRFPGVQSGVQPRFPLTENEE